jgi:hypothetical protein
MELKELYRLEINNRPVCVIQAECLPWITPRLRRWWLRIVVASALQRWQAREGDLVSFSFQA